MVEAKALVRRSCTPIAINASDSEDDTMEEVRTHHQSVGRHVPATSTNVLEHLSLCGLFNEKDDPFCQDGLPQLNGAGVCSVHKPAVCETAPALGIGECVVSGEARSAQ